MVPSPNGQKYSGTLLGKTIHFAAQQALKNNSSTNHIIGAPIFLGLPGGCAPPCAGQLHVLVNQVGYETRSPKQAVIEGEQKDSAQTFSLVDVGTQREVLSGKLEPVGPVRSWRDRVFWTADFSSWKQPGHYEVRVSTSTREVHSSIFEVGDNLWC